MGDGHDFPRLIDQGVPGVATVIDDVIEGFEDAVRQPVLAHELPDVFLAVELWGAPRQRQKRDVAWAGWVGSAAVEQVDLMLITSGYRRASACGTLSMPFCVLNRSSCYAPAMGLHLITI
jgi:hypothetical protein